MNDLLKRIEEYAVEGCDWSDTAWLINVSYRYANVPAPSQLHCLAYSLAKQIERLLLTNEVLKGQNADYATEVKRQDAEIERLEARIAKLEKPYVAMTEYDKSEILNRTVRGDNQSYNAVILRTEAAVIKRYNEQRCVK